MTEIKKGKRIKKKVVIHCYILLLGNTKLHGKLAFLTIDEGKPVAMVTKQIYYH